MIAPSRRAAAGVAVALGVASAAAGAVVLAVRLGGGPAERLFAAVCAATAAILVVSVVRGEVGRRRLRRQARTLAAVDPYEHARAAVVAERHRMSADLADRLRLGLAAVAQEADHALTADDPTTGIRSIRALASEATRDLRRQLGLLRTPAPAPPTPSTEQADGRPITRILVSATAAAVALAATEAYAHPRSEGLVPSWWSVVLTALTAATVLGVRISPARAALLAAGLFALGAAVGHPVHGGFWCLVTLGPLLWRLGGTTTTGRRPAAALAAAVLIATGGIATWVTTPDNAAVLVVSLAVFAIAGAVVGSIRVRADAARDEAERHRTDLDRDAATAVAAERGVFARKIHDAVSHAVGIVAVQAAAAEVSWPDDPRATRSALAHIVATAEATTDDLDRLGVPSARTIRRSIDDLVRLVDRLRAAGMSVVTDGLDEVPDTALDTVHHLVQEALTNVLRHAPGARARVRAVRVDGLLHLVVVDDGPGPAADTARGFGLVGLDERLTATGGRLAVGPGPDGVGLQVSATLPIARTGPHTSRAPA